MGVVKSARTKAYFKRYQVKFRRRRECKTDYYARKRLITQDKNKYRSPKYRLVVRFSNKDVVCQIIYAKIVGDHVMCAAYSHELPRYGVKVGLTNYAAAYCTGLLLARRLLTQLNIADKFEGKTDLEEEDSTLAPDSAFRAFLDVGLTRTNKGNRVFAAMKGAVDGGLDIPFKEKCLVGYNDKEKELDGAKLRSQLLGGHVAGYMHRLQDKKPEEFQSHFSRFIKEGLTAEGLEEMYKSAHAAIRADPSRQKREKVTEHKKLKRKRKLSLAEKKNRIKQKKASALKRAGRTAEAMEQN